MSSRLLFKPNSNYVLMFEIAKFEIKSVDFCRFTLTGILKLRFDFVVIHLLDHIPITANPPTSTK